MRNAVVLSVVGAPNEGARPPGAGGVGGDSGDRPMPGGVGEPGSASVAGPVGSLGVGAATSARAARGAASNAEDTSASERAVARRYERRTFKAVVRERRRPRRGPCPSEWRG